MIQLILCGLLLIWLFFAVRNWIWKRELVKLFDYGSVLVFGMRGRGKDTLFNYVINTRKQKYISNVKYTKSVDKFIQFDPLHQMDVGGNTPINLIENDIIPYEYPLEDGIDYYISDAQAYFPSQDYQYLNKRYRSLPLFQGISRHLGNCNVHCNTQVLNRVWDKLREQSDIYIQCRNCKYTAWYWRPWSVLNFLWFKNGRPFIDKSPTVKLKYIIYEKYEAALNNKRPYPRGHGKQYRAAKASYEAENGKILVRKIKFRSPYDYDDRVFKTILRGVPDETERA